MPKPAPEAPKPSPPSPTGTNNPYFDMLYEAISAPAQVLRPSIEKLVKPTR